jgi:hypothetical protein
MTESRVLHLTLCDARDCRSRTGFPVLPCLSGGDWLSIILPTKHEYRGMVITVATALFRPVERLRFFARGLIL